MSRRPKRLYVLLLVLIFLATIVGGMQAMAAGAPSVGPGGQHGSHGGTVNHAKLVHVRGAVSPLVARGKAIRTGALALGQNIRLALVLKPQNYSELRSLVAGGKSLPVGMSAAQFAPAADSVNAVTQFVKGNRLKVLQSYKNVLLVEGTAAQVEAAFRVQMGTYSYHGRTFYANANNPVLPSDIASALAGVGGLTQVEFKAGPQRKVSGSGGSGAGGDTAFLTPDGIRTAYGLTSSYGNDIDGTGQTIAVLMGGSFSPSDVQNFSQQFGIPFNANQVEAIPVPGTDYYDGEPLEVESTLDVDWSHAIAPGATIAEYEVGFVGQGRLSDNDLLAGLGAILSTNPAPVAINMSFGAPEDGGMPAWEAEAWEALFVQADAQGTTPVAASGDWGAYDPDLGTVSVSYPASDPFVLAVGGTTLTLNDNNTRKTETAWQTVIDGNSYSSGGGYSQVFADLTGNAPSNTVTGNVYMRGVPDVSMVAHNLVVYTGNYGWLEADGTSFAAPMWTGILALAAQKAGHALGWVRPAINALGEGQNYTTDFNDITTGDNGTYEAGTGWDPVTGWGSPGNGWALVQDLASSSGATLPTKPSISNVTVDGHTEPNPGIYFRSGELVVMGYNLGQTSGTATLTAIGGTASYSVPVDNWSDGEVDLNTDAMFLSAPFGQPQPEEYALTLTTASGTTNPVTVQVQDYFQVSDSGPATAVAAGQQPSFGNWQTVNIQVYLPDGFGVDTTAGTTASLGIYPPNLWETGNQPQLWVETMDGAPIQPSADGSYPVQVVNGQAQVQVASTGASWPLVQGGQWETEYDVWAPAEPDWGEMPDYSAVFNPAVSASLGGNNLGAGYWPWVTWTSGQVNQNLGVQVSLLDGSGNLITNSDAVTVSVYCPSSSGPVTLQTADGRSVSTSTYASINTNLSMSWWPSGWQSSGSAPESDNGYTWVEVNSSVPQTVVLSVYDQVQPSVGPLSIPLTFVQPTQGVLGTAGGSTTVSPPPGTSWQPVTFWSEGSPGVDRYPSLPSGSNDLALWWGDLNLNGSSFTMPTVQQQVYGTSNWSTLKQVFEEPWEPVAVYQTDLSNGQTNLQVASPEAGPIRYQEFVTFGYGGDKYGDWTNGGEMDSQWLDGTFTPGPEASLNVTPQFPHMATSAATALSFDPVLVYTADALGNPELPGADKMSLTETAGGPPVTVESSGQNLQANSGAWTFHINPRALVQLGIAATQTGTATFTLSDVSDPQVQPVTFSIDFVNSGATAMAVSQLADAVTGTAQTLSVSVDDNNGQPVVNNTDQVALTISGNSGTVTVTDGSGKTLSLTNGQYVTTASAGQCAFQVTDNTAESLTYKLSDLTQASVSPSTVSGRFVGQSAVSGYTFAPSPIATAGSLAVNATVPLTVTAEDASGPVSGAPVYLSFSGSGSVTVRGTPLTSTQSFKTGANGQIGITYSAPATLPSTGTDTITAASDTSGTNAATDSYNFTGTVSYPVTISGYAVTDSNHNPVTALTHGQQYYLSMTVNSASATPLKPLFLIQAQQTGQVIALNGLQTILNPDGSATVTTMFTPPSAGTVELDFYVWSNWAPNNEVLALPKVVGSEVVN